MSRRRRRRLRTGNNQLSFNLPASSLPPISSITFGLILLAMIFFLDPALIKNFIYPDSYALFFIILALFLLSLLYTLTKHLARTLILSTIITLALFLQLKDILNPIIFLLLLSLPTSYEIFFAPVETSWLKPLITLLMQYVRSRKKA